jgi:hypothetical protein
MATKVQRALAVLNALSDGTQDAAMAQRVGNAFVATYRPEASGLTNEQKAGIFLLHVRNFVVGVVRGAEVSAAAEAARLTALQTATIDIGTDGEIDNG